MMTENEKISFKTSLKEFCLKMLDERLETLEKLALGSQEAANNEDKSSAGDKYETGRAMGHLQKEMYQQQAAKIRHELLKTKSTPVVTQPGMIMKGTVILTDKLSVFICAGLGRKQLNGRTILFVSDEAPIYKQLYQKKVGDEIVIDRQSLPIREIW